MRTFTPSKAELSPSFPVEEQRHHVVCWPELFPLRAARAARCQGPKPRTALNPRTAHGAPSTHNPGAETKHTPRPLALQTCPRHLLGLLGVVPWPWARRELSPCSWTPNTSQILAGRGARAGPARCSHCCSSIHHPGEKARNEPAGEKREWHSLGQSVKVSAEAHGRG